MSLQSRISTALSRPYTDLSSSLSGEELPSLLSLNSSIISDHGRLYKVRLFWQVSFTHLTDQTLSPITIQTPPAIQAEPVKRPYKSALLAATISYTSSQPDCSALLAIAQPLAEDILSEQSRQLDKHYRSITEPTRDDLIKLSSRPDLYQSLMQRIVTTRRTVPQPGPDVLATTHSQAVTEKEYLSHLGMDHLLDEILTSPAPYIHPEIGPGAYQLATTIRLYQEIFSKLGANAVSDSLSPVADRAMEAWRTYTADQTSTMQIPSDLSRPLELQEALDRKKAYDPDEIVQPYVQACGELSQSLSEPRRSIFRLNCGLSGALVEYVHGWFVAESGIKAVDVNDNGALAECAERLDGFLPTSMEDARALLALLQDRGSAREICERAADEFVADFEEFEGRLDEQAREVFPRTSEEVRVLLS